MSGGIVGTNAMKYKVYLPNVWPLLKAYVPVFKYFLGILLLGSVFVAWTNSGNDWAGFLSELYGKINIVPGYVWILAVNFVIIPYVAVIVYRLISVSKYCSRNGISFSDFNKRSDREIRKIWD